MKTISPKTSLVLFSILSVLLYSCANDSNDTSGDIKDDPKFENFDFKTTKEIKVSVSTLNSEDKPMV